MALTNRLLALSLCAAPVAFLALPSAAQPGPAIATQLPRTAMPTRYTIRVEPNAQAMNFTATVIIDVTLLKATDTLVLNAADLRFGAIGIVPASGKPMAGQATLDTEAQTASLRFPSRMAPGRYRLSIAYSGIINTQANGLFALDYTDNQGAKQRALFTQFEAPDARRFVPSWDEPSYKAVFDLTAVVPASDLAVSNTPVRAEKRLGNGKKEVSFGVTPKMSSYLLFFGTGALERIHATAGKGPGATDVGVVTGKGNSGKAKLALDAETEILPYYNSYFGVKFPLPKLDNVAGPGQSQFFSAMENWGAIFTFERAMLVDPKLTSEAQKRRIYETTAHEMAHQWFGDLVTMAWWDDLWLNEGFASWMATKATDHFRPEWDFALTRVAGRESAMALDAYATTHPVVHHIATVDQVNQAFDSITYEKGEAVITMLEAFAGADTWQRGIQAYMRAFAYRNTVTDDLWRSVENAGGKGITRIAHEFTSQPGIALVKVDGATCQGGNTTLNLSQGEYSKDNPGKKPLSWHVPVMAATLGETGRRGAPQRMILSGKGVMSLPGCGPYVVNIGQAGYYRTLYPADNVAALARGFARIAPIDQLGLMADGWQLAEAGYQPAALALDLVDAVPGQANAATLNAVANYVRGAWGYFDGDDTDQARIAAWGRAKLEPWLTRIGFDTRPGENSSVALLRATLVDTLGRMGSPVVVAEARRRFAEPRLLDGPLRGVWLSAVARNADAATWDKLHQMARTAPTYLEKSALYANLGEARDPAIAQRALDLALSDEPDKTTGAAIIAAVSGENSERALDFALAHREQYEGLVDISARSRAMARLAGGSEDPATIDKLNAYAAKYLTPQSRKPVDETIAAIKGRIAIRARMKPQVSAWVTSIVDR